MPPATLSSVNITILGSASAQPSSTRNHSAFALRLGGDVWLFDCGEATQHRVQKSTVKMGRIQKIFITHTHGDHIFGLLPLLASRLDGAGGVVDADDPRTKAESRHAVPPLEIYGPLGAPYVVHELRFISDPPLDPTALPPHSFELPGRDLQQVDGVWPEIYRDDLVTVSAAPIMHSVPCVGYVVTELPVPGKMDPKLYIPHLKRTKMPMSLMSRLQQGESVELSDGTVLRGPPRRPGRKLVILGDTYDPSPIADLAADADILVHEATNSHLPGVDPETKAEDTHASVEARAKSRGHSTPQMAGRFARRIRARKLLLNHFSARYAGNDDVDEQARSIMEAIKALAVSEFDGEVVCARDFMSFDVELRQEG